MTSAGNTAVCNDLAMVLGGFKQFNDTISKADGTAQDITGWGLSFVIHRYGDPGTVLLTKTNAGGGGIIVNLPATGVLLTTFNPTDTAGWAPGSYEYTVNRTDNNFNDVLSYGVMTLLAS